MPLPLEPQPSRAPLHIDIASPTGPGPSRVPLHATILTRTRTLACPLHIAHHPWPCGLCYWRVAPQGFEVFDPFAATLHASPKWFEKDERQAEPLADLMVQMLANKLCGAAADGS